MKTDNERMINVGEDVALHLGPLAVPHLQRGLLEHFHCIEGSGVGRRDLAHQEHLAERALAQHFE